MTMTPSSTSTPLRKPGIRLGYRFNIVGMIGLAIILSWAARCNLCTAYDPLPGR